MGVSWAFCFLSSGNWALSSEPREDQECAAGASDTIATTVKALACRTNARDRPGFGRRMAGLYSIDGSVVYLKPSTQECRATELRRKLSFAA